MQWTQECEISTAWCQLQCTPSTTMAIKHETYSSCRSHDKTEIDDTASVMYELVFVCYTRRVRHPPPIPLLPAPSLEHTLSVDLLTEDILLLHHYSSPSSITCVPGHLAPKLLMIFHHWRKRKVKKKKKNPLLDDFSFRGSVHDELLYSCFYILGCLYYVLVSYTISIWYTRLPPLHLLFYLFNKGSMIYSNSMMPCGN